MLFLLCNYISESFKYFMRISIIESFRPLAASQRQCRSSKAFNLKGSQSSSRGCKLITNEILHHFSSKFQLAAAAAK